MQRIGTGQRRNGRRLRASGLRRWCVLLLTLAVAASGLLHLVDDAHTALAASHSHELASVIHDAGDDPCSRQHDGEPHGTICSMANGCPLFVPVTSSAQPPQPNAEPAELQPQAARSGRVLSPHPRPPKLLNA
jgi:hypothetical protein